MKTINEMIAVMTAYKEGKTIEGRLLTKNEYFTIKYPGWNWDTFDYRVKPEPKYRPYKDAEECFKDVQKHGGWVISGGNQYRQITGVGYGCNSDIVKMSGCNWMKFGELLEAVWADDGTPCGVLGEE